MDGQAIGVMVNPSLLLGTARPSIFRLPFSEVPLEPEGGRSGNFSLGDLLLILGKARPSSLWLPQHCLLFGAGGWTVRPSVLCRPRAGG